MIAGIERGNIFCVIRWVGRVGLKAKVFTYCGHEGDAGAGVVQIPERVVMNGQTFPSADGRRMITPCKTCCGAIR